MNSVTITKNEDGSFTVEGQEPYMETEEGSVQDMAEDTQEGAQTFATAEEACDAAVAMLGGSGEPMIDGEEDLQAAFEGGFKQARGV
jgi:hypothetical protein